MRSGRNCRTRRICRRHADWARCATDQPRHVQRTHLAPRLVTKPIRLEKASKLLLPIDVLPTVVGPSKSRPPMSHRKTDLGIPSRSRSAKVELVEVSIHSKPARPRAADRRTHRAAWSKSAPLGSQTHIHGPTLMLRARRYGIGGLIIGRPRAPFSSSSGPAPTLPGARRISSCLSPLITSSTHCSCCSAFCKSPADRSARVGLWGFSSRELESDLPTGAGWIDSPNVSLPLVRLPAPGRPVVQLVYSYFVRLPAAALPVVQLVYS